jgi:GTP cyclohydrolase I
MLFKARLSVPNNRDRISMSSDKPASSGPQPRERAAQPRLAAVSSAKPADAPARAPLVRPSRADAEAAVRTLLAWAGDDPAREGLLDTPRRVTDAFDEWFAGYGADPNTELSRVFEEASGYDDIVMLRDIDVQSHCEHHMAPFIGTAHVAYMPKDRIVGLSKIARVVEIFAKRLQTQETMTAQIADAISSALKPRGVAVYIDAVHQCMTTRGVRHHDVSTITTRFTGVFRDSSELRERFLRLAQG